MIELLEVIQLVTWLMLCGFAFVYAGKAATAIWRHFNKPKQRRTGIRPARTSVQYIADWKKHNIHGNN